MLLSNKNFVIFTKALIEVLRKIKGNNEFYKINKE